MMLASCEAPTNLSFTEEQELEAATDATYTDTEGATDAAGREREAQTPARNWWEVHAPGMQYCRWYDYRRGIRGYVKVRDTCDIRITVSGRRVTVSWERQGGTTAFASSSSWAAPIR